VLQFLPSGACVSLILERPTILGRDPYPDPYEALDLTDLNAYQHGVSRRHCRLERRGEHLVAVDLDSTNGTYLNGEALQPQREYVVSHGDKLILGTLHLTISFSPIPTD
jgi:pSer/pThr/pTyr-binding forkhead associated (FHA) protein